MNVTLNIENDQELRSYIKDCIKGQVLSFVREEFQDMVMQELSRKMKGAGTPQFEKMYREAFEMAIRQILYKEHKVSSWNSDFITPVVEKNVKEAIKGKSWDKLVDDLAKEKIKQLIK